MSKLTFAFACALTLSACGEAASGNAGRVKPVHRSQFHCEAYSQPPPGGRRGSGPLLPGKPKALVLCLYGPPYGPFPSPGLKASKLLTHRKQVRRVVQGLNALPPMPKGPISCPADDGSSIVVLAMYRRSAPSVVQIGLSGCLIARRGDVVRWDIPSHGRFIHTLESLTR